MSRFRFKWLGRVCFWAIVRRESLPTPVFLPGEFHGLCSPWGRQELDTTEWLSLSLSKCLCLHQRKAHVYVLSHFSCLTLCKLMEHGMPSSSDHGILPSRILEWVAMHSSRGSSWPRIELCLLPLLHWQAGFTTSPTWEAHQRKMKKKKKSSMIKKKGVCLSACSVMSDFPRPHGL